MSLHLKLGHYLNRFRYRRRNRMLPDVHDGGSVAACGQDALVSQILGLKRNGVFVDIGANDGVTISNTLFFERERGWTGVAIEPIPSVFEKLKANRTCHLVQGCVTPQAGKAKFTEMTGGPNMLSTLSSFNNGLTARRMNRNVARQKTEMREIEVDCFTFGSLMERFGITEIDFLSVDTEGGELEILKSIDFDRFPVRVVSVENNFYSSEIRSYMEASGFLYLGTVKVDELYLFGGAGFRESCRNASF